VFLDAHGLGTLWLGGPVQLGRRGHRRLRLRHDLLLHHVGLLVHQLAHAELEQVEEQGACQQEGQDQPGCQQEQAVREPVLLFGGGSRDL